MEPTMNDLMNEIKQLKTEVSVIIENIHDEDSQLTEEEEKLLEKSYENEKEDKLMSSNNLKKELGI